MTEEMLRITEVVSPNAKDLRESGRSYVLELRLNRPLTGWETSALRVLRPDADVKDATVTFRPVGPHTLGGLVKAIEDLPSVARDLLQQTDANAREILEAARAELAGTDIPVRQANEFMDGVFGPR